MKKALICGISGQDGSYLAKFLVDKGYTVFGTSRDAELSSFKNLEVLGISAQIKFYSMSLVDFRSVLQVVTEVEPDEIYNLAGQTSVGLSFEQPVETLESIAYGTLNLLEVIKYLGGRTRFYNASSTECFGESTRQSPADEETGFKPRSPYGVAKATACWTVRNYREAYGLYACSGLLSNHESPLRPQRFVTRKIVSAAYRISNGSQEKLELGNISVVRDWGWAPDYVEAMWLMLQQTTSHDFVISTGKSYSLNMFLEKVFEQCDLNWKEHTLINEVLLRDTDIENSFSTPKLAKTILGWEAKTQFNEIITKLVEAEKLRGNE